MIVQDASTDPMGMLLFEYMVHEGYWETATKVAQDILLDRVKVSQQVCMTGNAACISPMLDLCVCI